jgi:serine/threonine protein kinase
VSSDPPPRVGRYTARMPDTGPFDILEIPASGSYGTVCVARPRGEPGRIVALKVLKTGLSENPKIIGRARDEARMLFRLKHPDIVAVDGLVEINGRPVLVMEYVEGVSLQALLARHRDGLPWAVALEIARRTAGALHAAYESRGGPEGEPMRIIHRDIKPGNLLLSIVGAVKVVDFGIAHADFSDRESTTISTVMGSQNYVAPERIDGSPVTPSVDVYGLGVTLFELLCGKILLLPRQADRQPIALKAQLDKLEPRGLPAPLLIPVRDLIARMVDMAVDRRPPSLEVALTIASMFESAGVTPDLAAFSRQHVKQLFDARPRLPPRAHPDYPEVAFLEQDDLPREDTALEPTGEVDTSKERADRRVRRFLATQDWPARLRDLRWLLANNPMWTETPFLDVLRDAQRPWWAFWRPAAPPDRIVAVLEVLRYRRTAPVLRAAEAYAHDRDPRIAAAARALLEGVPP